MKEWRGVRAGTSTPTVSSDLRVGGSHHYAKVSTTTPPTRVTTDAVFTQFFPLRVLATRRRITEA
jgi:hypothetical protein